jgi:hypothetical protein
MMGVINPPPRPRSCRDQEDGISDFKFQISKSGNRDRRSRGDFKFQNLETETGVRGAISDFKIKNRNGRW